MGRNGTGKPRKEGSRRASLVLGTAEKSGSVIHMLPRKQQHSPCSWPAQDLQPCHNVLSLQRKQECALRGSSAQEVMLV